MSGWNDELSREKVSEITDFIFLKVGTDPTFPSYKDQIFVFWGNDRFFDYARTRNN